jgi:hypothetical protein
MLCLLSLIHGIEVPSLVLPDAEIEDVLVEGVLSAVVPYGFQNLSKVDQADVLVSSAWVTCFPFPV